MTITHSKGTPLKGMKYQKEKSQCIPAIYRWVSTRKKQTFQYKYNGNTPFSLPFILPDRKSKHVRVLLVAYKEGTINKRLGKILSWFYKFPLEMRFL